MTIQFYHLLHTPLDFALPKLLAKAQEAGLRSVVVGETSARLQQLSDKLWEVEPNSFLAHGFAPDDPSGQPIWLSTEIENPNEAKLIAITNGASLPEPQAWDKIIDLFDGHDEAAVTAARQRWKQYKEQGVELKYFQQHPGGGWKQAA
ncbi:MAG: DNA polymerase III subunit chi [Rickettsiales bacterium]|nr:DNA polymerase III subunit chi [Rickettsiales bacterium]